VQADDREKRRLVDTVMKIVRIFAFYLSFFLSISAADTRFESASLDPWFLVESSVANRPPLVAGTSGAATFPALFVWRSTDRSKPDALRHELGHVRQIEALGAPTFQLVYSLSGGSVFEDYLTTSPWAPPAWTGAPRCPLLTLGRAGFSFWACSSLSPR
jgi:hypothetical protein